MRLAGRLHPCLPYLATVLTFGVGLGQKWPCVAAGWPYDRDLIFGQRCYSDIPVLYLDRGLADGVFPYATERSLEYPVLTGYLMDLTARPVGTPGAYFLLNVLVLLACALGTVWATVALTGRMEAGLIVAFAPTLALAGTINWDLLAVLPASLALLAWARDRPGWAGVAIGLGTAAKLYPALLLFGMGLLALRAAMRDRTGLAAWRPFLTATGAALISWVLVNAPVALFYPAGWATFWQFNADRGAEFGSVFYALLLLGHPTEPLNLIAMLALLACLVAVAGHAVTAAAAPPLPVLAMLTVAAFLVTNKVYSPQYVLWLLPLAVAAGARLRFIVAWQLAEVAYWSAVWGHLAGTTGVRVYTWATFLHVAATVLMAVATAARPHGFARAPHSPAAVPGDSRRRAGWNNHRHV